VGASILPNVDFEARQLAAWTGKPLVTCRSILHRALARWALEEMQQQARRAVREAREQAVRQAALDRAALSRYVYGGRNG
jgi:hypothetical protein